MFTTRDQTCAVKHLPFGSLAIPLWQNLHHWSDLIPLAFTPLNACYSRLSPSFLKKILPKAPSIHKEATDPNAAIFDIWNLVSVKDHIHVKSQFSQHLFIGIGKKACR